ncbi:MAG: nitrile hydratase subunit beta [Pararhodobacter sp.]
MNGPHDLGGQMGFGALPLEPDEPLFHAPWEARALGITLACGALGHWSLDESRHARESLPPATYLGSSYYEIWIRALEALLQRHALIDAAELATGHAQGQTPHPRKLTADRVAPTLAAGNPTSRKIAAAPRFRPGDRVRARTMHPHTHTRLPRYLRGHLGTVEADHGGHVFADTSAHGLGEQPQRLYTVVFDGAEVWGHGAEPGLTISADLWESYLDPA